jgi:hypothetical protein
MSRSFSGPPSGPPSPTSYRSRSRSSISYRPRPRSPTSYNFPPRSRSTPPNSYRSRSPTFYHFPLPSRPRPTTSSPSTLRPVIDALDAYKKRTKKDLLAHPLFTQLRSCDSPSAILAVLQQQLQGSDQSGRSDERWTRWLDPTVNVLYTLSEALEENVSLVRLRS